MRRRQHIVRRGCQRASEHLSAAQRSVADRHKNLPPFPTKTYDIVYADPPWFYYGSQIKDAAAGETLSAHGSRGAGDARRSARIMNKRAALFSVVDRPAPEFRDRPHRSWGLHYRGVAYVWVKTNSKGEPICGQGVPPDVHEAHHGVRARGHDNAHRPTLPDSRPRVRAKSIMEPRAEHSRKPAIFRQRIEETVRSTLAHRALLPRIRERLGRLGAEAGKLDETRRSS